LEAIAQHAGHIQRSVETGSGATTLLLSHLSQHHTVFAFDAAGSVSNVKSSPLFHAVTTTYIEGPTQVTLPKHTFSHKIQFALIDGAHSYPFPDMDYFYFYPLIEPGGILVVDDIQIPSIRRMYDIIRADDMWEYIEVVHRNMAFFRRTGAPTMDPHSDRW